MRATMKFLMVLFVTPVINFPTLDAQCFPANVVIGGLCSVDEDCVSCPNSHCNPETILVCRCNADFVPKLDVTACLPKQHGIGGSCEQSSQCQLGNLGDLSDCIDFSCQCSEGSVYVSSLEKCLEKSDLIGDPCEGLEQCTVTLGSEAVCEGGHCGCRVETSIPREGGTFCLPFVYNFEDHCEMDVQCRQDPPAPGPLSFCETTCKCSDISIRDYASGVCLPKAGMREDCTTHAQCESILGVHGFCKIVSDPPGICGCNEDTSIPHEDRCYGIVNELGAMCEIHGQCETGLPGPLSECQVSPETEEKVCQCNHKAVTKPATDNICYRVAEEVGGHCEFREQCTESLGHLSECVSPGLCRCSAGSVANTENNKCIPGPHLIGDGCHDNNQCPLLSFCSDGYVCRCNSGLTSSSDRTRCLPIINTINVDICEEVQQCKLGTPGQLSDCRNSIWNQDLRCNCLETAVDVGHHVCYRKAVQIGDSCVSREQCTENLGDLSECVESTCVCSSGSVEGSEGTFCFPGPGLVGSLCSDQNQCPTLSTCEGDPKTCQCVANHVASGRKDRCLPIVNTVELENCEEGVQCQAGRPGELSDCQLDENLGKVCLCKVNEALTLPEHHICYRLAKVVGDTCETLEQCFVGIGPLSECVGGVCGCISGSFVTPDKKCSKGPLLIGDECEDSLQCPTESTCLHPESTCECNRGYVSSTSKEECLPVINFLGRQCKEDQQCRAGDPGTYSECKMEESQNFLVCQCASDATSVGSQQVCYLKANLVGGRCQYEEQCKDVESSYCDLGLNQCLCDANHVPSGNRRRCLKKASLGETCEDTIQCQAADSICSGVKCECRAGYETPPIWENACYKLATQIGDDCLKGEFQCRELVGAKCRQNGESLACLCDETTEVVSKDRRRCLPVVGLGGICEEADQCRGSNLECSLKDGSVATCRCKSGHTESTKNPGNCVKLAEKLFDSCDEDVQCTVGIGDMTTCRNGRCDCVGTSQPFENYCYYPARLGMLCAATAECVLGVNSRALCAQRNEGGPEICRCIPQTIESGGLCWENKRVGDSCTADQECRVSIVGGVFCETGSNKCVCFPGYEPKLAGTFCESGVGTREVNKWFMIIIVAVSLFGIVFEK